MARCGSAGCRQVPKEGTPTVLNRLSGPKKPVASGGVQKESGKKRKNERKRTPPRWWRTQYSSCLAVVWMPATLGFHVGVSRRVRHRAKDALGSKYPSTLAP